MRFRRLAPLGLLALVNLLACGPDATNEGVSSDATRLETPNGLFQNGLSSNGLFQDGLFQNGLFQNSLWQDAPWQKNPAVGSWASTWATGWRGQLGGMTCEGTIERKPERPAMMMHKIDLTCDPAGLALESRSDE